ncbi:MAG TPA: hypothetical protein VJ837_03070 [Candidatus Paceibacterota bacterium]|nr:hypothetical protein [Candidatus Paceibacterota bacterium]
MKNIFSKPVPLWITYPVLVIFALSVVGTGAYFYVPKAIAQWFPPFEGRITYVEYNCLCSGSIMLTIVASTPSGLQNQPQPLNLMYYWAADALGKIAGELFAGFPFPIPTIFPFYMIFNPGEQRLLGLYAPGGVPCVAYVGSACSITQYADGILLFVGTSLY